MTFPINPNIPAAGNDPADDQPLMQQNFSNINGYLQVDHTNPAATGAGFHEQVTFFANNPPVSFPVDPPVLFTNDMDGAGNALPGGVPELFFYSGTTNQSKANYVAQPTGGTFLMGGVIAKWGTVTPSGSGFNQTVTFPVPFPNACFMVVATLSASSTAAINYVTSWSATGFGVVRTSSSVAIQINYIAIGN